MVFFTSPEDMNNAYSFLKFCNHSYALLEILFIFLFIASFQIQGNM